MLVTEKTAPRLNLALKERKPFLNLSSQIKPHKKALLLLAQKLQSTQLQKSLRQMEGRLSTEFPTTLVPINMLLTALLLECKTISSLRPSNGQRLLFGPTTHLLRTILIWSSWTGLEMTLTWKRKNNAYQEDSRMPRASGVEERYLASSLLMMRTKITN